MEEQILVTEDENQDILNDVVEEIEISEKPEDLEQNNGLIDKESSLDISSKEGVIEKSDKDIKEELKNELISQKIEELKILLSQEDINFKDLLYMTNKNEYSSFSGCLSKFISRKKDWKFKLEPTYGSLLELANEVCCKIIPIIHYAMVRLKALDNIYYALRWERILKEIEEEKLLSLYFRYNSSRYGNTLIYYKLNRLLDKNEEKLRLLVSFIYTIFPIKERPIRTQDVGLSIGEFNEIDRED